MAHRPTGRWILRAGAATARHPQPHPRQPGTPGSAQAHRPTPVSAAGSPGRLRPELSDSDTVLPVSGSITSWSQKHALREVSGHLTGESSGTSRSHVLSPVVPTAPWCQEADLNFFAWSSTQPQSLQAHPGEKSFLPSIAPSPPPTSTFSSPGNRIQLSVSPAPAGSCTGAPTSQHPGQAGDVSSAPIGPSAAFRGWTTLEPDLPTAGPGQSGPRRLPRPHHPRPSPLPPPPSATVASPRNFHVNACSC